MAKAPGTLAASWIIARKDLAIEFRTRTAFLSALVFALLGVTIFYFAWDATAVAAADLAPGVLWVIFTFAGLLGLQRSFGSELADRAIDGLLGARVSRDQRIMISWFGIRGIGSIYYLMYAINRGLPQPLAEHIIALTLTMVAASIVLHGISVTPLMERYAHRKAQRSADAQDRPSASK